MEISNPAGNCHCQNDRNPTGSAGASVVLLQLVMSTAMPVHPKTVKSTCPYGNEVVQEIAEVYFGFWNLTVDSERHTHKTLIVAQTSRT